jgi:hypothetical protein
MITLSGTGPFELPATLSGAAAGDSREIVSLTLSLAEPTEESQWVSTQMTAEVARDLAIRLWLAADESERKT